MSPWWDLELGRRLGCGACNSVFNLRLTPILALSVRYIRHHCPPTACHPSVTWSTSHPNLPSQPPIPSLIKHQDLRGSCGCCGYSRQYSPPVPQYPYCEQHRPETQGHLPPLPLPGLPLAESLEEADGFTGPPPPPGWWWGEVLALARFLGGCGRGRGEDGVSCDEAPGHGEDGGGGETHVSGRMFWLLLVGIGTVIVRLGDGWMDG